MEGTQFHTMVAKGLFLCKRARPDIAPVIAFLCTRVKEPTKQDWGKLHRMMLFLNTTKEDVLTLRSDKSHKVKYYVDAAYAVHPDMKSHTGIVMTMGYGAVISSSLKQKMNSRSSTEAECIGVDDAISLIIWSLRFLEAQGYEVQECIVYQDNESAIKLQRNGRWSAGKRSRHLDIKIFYIKDQIDKGLLDVKYCPTDQMMADYMTKSLQGSKFGKQRRFIMNLKEPSKANNYTLHKKMRNKKISK